MLDLWYIIFIVIIFGLSLQYSPDTFNVVAWYIPHLVLGLFYFMIKIYLVIRRNNFDVFSLAPTKDELYDSVLGGLIGFLASIIVSSFFSLSGDTLMLTLSESSSVYVIMILFGSAMEEILWRGAVPFSIAIGTIPIWRKFETENLGAEEISFAFGYIVSSVLFGIRHIFKYMETFGVRLGILMTVSAILFGLIMSFVATRYGLMASIIAHTMYNLFVYCVVTI